MTTGCKLRSRFPVYRINSLFIICEKLKVCYETLAGPWSWDGTLSLPNSTLYGYSTASTGR